MDADLPSDREAGPGQSIRGESEGERKAKRENGLMEHVLYYNYADRTGDATSRSVTDETYLFF
uniref:Uncharacterized protein n=1 Tax=Thermogemmatispora argillosa TaxID=2045280 RepID=A0A455T0N0_9CHLR|nr:hypothetical protein KTA_01640 [Thermogemmatispora argillosa]